jgi:prepilin-type processing-associated H-X9-DG protein
VSILLPSLQSAKEIARSLVCMSNLKNIGLGIVQYADDYDGQMCKSFGCVCGWWPYNLGHYGYLPLPAGFKDEERDKTMQDVWNCPTAMQLYTPTGAIHTGWTYLRMSNNYPYWKLCGTAELVKLDEIESPSNQIFVIDGILIPNENGGNYPYAGSMNGASTRFGLTAAPYSGSGGAGFDHPGETANCLFADWHVENLGRGDIDEDMCESPDPE